jgi:hypothetical protein
MQKVVAASNRLAVVIHHLREIVTGLVGRRLFCIAVLFFRG